MNDKTQVTKEEFEEFIRQYDSNIHKLIRDVTHICTPPLVSYNDFSLGKWPDSVVASMCWGESMYGYFETKEENDKNCTNEYYIKTKFLTEEYKEIMEKDYKKYYNQIIQDIIQDDEFIREMAAKVLSYGAVYGNDRKEKPTITEIVVKLVRELEIAKTKIFS